MANYNSYFPQGYTNNSYGYGVGASPVQSWAQPTYAQGQPGAINWVQGEAGAKSIPVPAGQKAILMDSETNVFYIKSSDTSGMPLPLRTFEYKEINNGTATPDEAAPNTYVTHEELDKILAALKEEKKEEKKNEQFII